MPFDPNTCPENPPFIRPLCKSLYYENLLVRLPMRAVLCRYGMTPQGRVQTVDETHPDETIAAMPFPPQVLSREEQADYEAQVGQEDPDALGPGFDRNWWAWAVAAFRYAGGCKPESPEGTDRWMICHLYSLDVSTLADQRYHFTQSANLVAVHPVVQHLMAQYTCVVKTLQATSGVRAI